LQKEDSKIVFDIVIQTKMGMLFCMYFRRGHKEIAYIAADNKVTKMSIREAHDKLGHGDEPSTWKAAKELGIEITRGAMKPCETCTIAKAKHKNVPKESSSVVATKDKGRIYLDISTIKKEKDGPSVTKGNWRIMVDERLPLKFSEFFQTKSGMIEPTCQQLFKWQQAGLPVKYVRLDNAGENKALQNRTESSDWKMSIEYEYTAWNTPQQQNHLAELGFASLANKGRAMMAAANIPMQIRYKIYREALKTATVLDGLMVVEIDGMTASRYKHFFGENPKFSNFLRTWGEAGTVTIKGKMHPKVADRGIQCMFTGYANDHTGDCYRM
jgi:hypothetical protein